MLNAPTNTNAAAGSGGSIARTSRRLCLLTLEEGLAMWRSPYAGAPKPTFDGAGNIVPAVPPAPEAPDPGAPEAEADAEARRITEAKRTALAEWLSQAQRLAAWVETSPPATRYRRARALRKWLGAPDPLGLREAARLQGKSASAMFAGWRRGEAELAAEIEQGCAREGA